MVLSIKVDNSSYIGNNIKYQGKGCVQKMKDVIVLQDLTHFDIKQILESGQVFRYETLSDSTYLLIANQKILKISQKGKSIIPLIQGTTRSEFDQHWDQYFDLSTDYHFITQTLSEKDDYMKQAIAFGEGIRILKQDPWEMLISFIISQNKSIPHIKQCINNISQAYGCPIQTHTSDTKIYYTFPSPEELIRASEDDLRACKVGFRAPYIRDACEKIYNEAINLTDLYAFETEQAKEELMKIKGVGPKIADCILLFAYGKTEVFPTDVWIKRVVEGLYFNGEEKNPAYIHAFAKEYFGKLAGYAQQYLFFYGRENALFK